MVTHIRLEATPEDPETWWWKQFAVDVPEGKQGNWEISRFSVSVMEAHYNFMRNAANGVPERSVAAGTYTRLVCGGDTIVMSDTPAEIKDHIPLFENMTGDVLIFGLGLGMAAQAALNDTDVRSVLVVELSQDVIDLVTPHLAKKFGDRISVRCDDAMTYHKTCRTKFDAVWHDIWPTISTKDLPEIQRLRKAWRRRAKWQGVWADTERSNLLYMEWDKHG